MFAKLRFDRAMRALATSDHAVLRDYAKAAWPDRDTPVMDTNFLALDFELDGLRKDAHLLQAGWVPFEGSSISLGGACSIDIQSDAALDPQAVTIHGIGEQRASQGVPIAEVITDLIAALSGRVMVAHAAGIEVSGLQRAAQAVFGVYLPIRCVCTLVLERTLHPNAVGAEPYRLGPARARYGLPEYQAHDALTDAIAAAELFQAQLSRMPHDVRLARVEHS